MPATVFRTFLDKKLKLSVHTLYHYTDQDGFMGLLSHQKLWASDGKFLNDSKELKIAYELLVKSIENRRDNFREKHSEVLGLQYIEKIYDHLLADIDDYLKLNKTYICCFSTKYDDLNQWRSYTGNKNGYMIGFNCQTLINEVAQSTEIELVECLYDRSKQVKKIDSFLANYEGLLDGVFPAFKKGELNEDFAEHIIKRLVKEFCTTISPSFKHPAFHEESEWRLVVTNPASEVEFRSRESSITPYVKIPFQYSYERESMDINKDGLIIDIILRENLITSVMIRPHIDQDFVLEGAERYLKSLGLEDTGVSKTKIPYRAY